MVRFMRAFLALCFCLSLVQIARSEPHHLASITGYECATADGCDETCQKMHAFIMEHDSAGWAIRHSSLSKIYHNHGCEVSVEIGMAFGGLTRHLLSSVKSIKEYHAIDPFLGGYDTTDAMSNFLNSVNASEAWNKAILYQLRKYGCRFKLHSGFSNEVAVHFQNDTIDCIFIDGDHTYEGVKNDIINYYPKVKTGGLMIFDDYSWQYMGLVKAVDNFVDTNHIPLTKINAHNNYYLVKPDRPLEFMFQYEVKR